jgi:hypothetical protein
MSAISASIYIPREDPRLKEADPLPRNMPRETSPSRPRRLVRLLALVCAGALDRRLIESPDAALSPLLAARGARLSEPRTRVLLAEGLERLLDASDGPRGRWSAVASREPLRANRDRLRELALTLRGDTPLNARGIAIVSDLLGDGTGPAYHGGSDQLAQRLEQALAAMRG